MQCDRPHKLGSLEEMEYLEDTQKLVSESYALSFEIRWISSDYIEAYSHIKLAIS